MASPGLNGTTRSPARRAASWVAPLAGVALLGLFSAQALGQSAAPRQISVPSLPTTLPLPPPPLPPPPPLLPPPPLPTTTTTVSTPVATAPVPVPATPPAPAPKPVVPPAPSAPAAGSAPAGATAGSSTSIPGSASSASAGGADEAAAGGRAHGRTASRARGLRAKPAKFAPGSKRARGGTVLVFRLAKPARLLVTVYGPGPSCRRLATFSRRGRPGVNRLPFSGTLFGRPLAPGRYAIVVEAVRGGERVRIGRVLVVILARDGREGGSRPLAAPDCDRGAATAFLASAGDFGRLGSEPSGGSESGGVAGVSAARGDGDEGDRLPLLPELPALPALPSFPAEDPFDVPPWALPALGALAVLGAAALVVWAIRRRREYAGWD